MQLMMMSAKQPSHSLTKTPLDPLSSSQSTDLPNMVNNSNGYHGLKDRRQRPSTPYALLGAACVALGMLGCVLLFTGFFDNDEALLNIPPPAVVPKVYMHPASCLDAGTSLFRVHGSGQQEAIDEHQMLLVGFGPDSARWLTARDDPLRRIS